MTIDVRLTSAQAMTVCELITKADQADFRTRAALSIDGHSLRTLNNAAKRLIVALFEQGGFKHVQLRKPD